MKRLLAAMLLLAPAVSAQMVHPTPAGIVVAHDGKLELEGHWTVDGVDHPHAMASGRDAVAVLDPLANTLVLADLATGRSTRHTTDETPVDLAFVGDQLYVLARDARTLRRIEGPAIPLAEDPAFLRVADGRLYVYSRAGGLIQEIENDRVTRQLEVPPSASDFEVRGTTAWLVYPREARIRTIDLDAMKQEGELAAGAVPVDVAVAGGGSAITAPILAIADPSAKRVWLAEAEHSVGKAIARGFIRGLLGLGLFAARDAQFPTGVDRVEVAGDHRVAYDSSSRTLYRFDRRKSSVVARDVAPGAFAVSEEGIVWWGEGRLRRLR